MKMRTLRSRILTAGFTLIETAMVLLIIGLLLGGLFGALGQSTENTRRTEARAQIQSVEEALYGFAQANGRLPCPSTLNSAGMEAPLGGGDCTADHGFVPAVTLGLQGSYEPAFGLLLDPWANPLRYSVSNLTVSTPAAFTSVAGMQELFNGGLPTAGSYLEVCDVPACNGQVFINTAPAVIVSMGKNWAIFNSSNENENSRLGTPAELYRATTTNTFVVAGYDENNFDDLLGWLSPNVLFARMITAGKLP